MPLDLPDRLIPKDVRLGGGYAVGEYFMEVLPGVKPRHVVHPDFWVHLAQRLSLYTEILVIAQDGSFEMRVRVMEVNKLWARVRAFAYVPAEGVPIPDDLPDAPEVSIEDEEFDDGYKIEFRGRAKFRITDRFGNTVDEEIPTKALARAKLDEIRRAKRAA